MNTVANDRGWWFPAALVALVVLPVLAGSRRVIELAELAGPARITPDNARFFEVPALVAAHIVGASLFCVLGAFQLAPHARRRWPGWHRAAGRLSIGCGLGAGLSGLWLTVFQSPAGDGALLNFFRLVFGGAMVASMVLGLDAILRRDIARHRAWITRGYAIAMGAGTQALLHLPWIAIAGPPAELARALLHGAGWAINLAIAEWAIRARPLG